MWSGLKFHPDRSLKFEIFALRQNQHVQYNEEGGIAPRPLYGMNYNGNQPLCTKTKIILIGLELMKLWWFFISFSLFCWFLDIQLTSASGRSGLFKTIVWDEFYYRMSAWIPSKQIGNRTRIHEVVEVFHPISPILLIFRISTDQRLSKEQSVQDDCMGWIVVSIERLDSVETEWELHQNSWR